jgi:hypothetical protein
MRGCRIFLGLSSACLLSFAASIVAAAHDRDAGWVELVGPHGLEAWREPRDGWSVVASAAMDPKALKQLTIQSGSGVIYNGPTGRGMNLLSKEKFADLEVCVEFLIPKGSNSGVKLQGLYEIQIYDSWGVTKPKSTDCGGVYHRAELRPVYHSLDEGYPPLVNASRPAGEWQTLDIVFRAPRFDASGAKTANARFVKVALNGRMVQENLEIPTPTGHAWREPEVATGPLLLQADHGPVAFRSVRVRPLKLD